MEINLQKLDTEQVNENTKNIDNLSTIDMITTINNEDKEALEVEKVNTLASQKLLMKLITE